MPYKLLLNQNEKKFLLNVLGLAKSYYDGEDDDWRQEQADDLIDELMKLEWEYGR